MENFLLDLKETLLYLKENVHHMTQEMRVPVVYTRSSFQLPRTFVNLISVLDASIFDEIIKQDGWCGPHRIHASYTCDCVLASANASVSALIRPLCQPCCKVFEYAFIYKLNRVCFTMPINNMQAGMRELANDDILTTDDFTVVLQPFLEDFVLPVYYLFLRRSFSNAFNWGVYMFRIMRRNILALIAFISA